ncbi:MAG TPA: uroporphyrinogen-III synthase [Ramlibacter sp.]|nr:uroporphyrinogen-III synthase [Ramlibacter sp.]
MTGAVVALVTRPEREAVRWTQALRERGVAAESLPLIAIAAAPPSPQLKAARAGLAKFAAVMFVSANAVEGLLASAQGSVCVPWPQRTRAWATGPGTGDALLAAGVPPAQIDVPNAAAAQFDSETLWSQVSKQVGPGDEVLIVRGGDASGQPTGRDWLARQIEATGATPRAVTAYLRQPPAWDAAQRSRAMAAASDGSWWIFSSSEAVGHLVSLLPGQGWSKARAVCTHPRIERAAQDAGFGVVNTSRPVLDAVAGFLQSHT